MLLLRHSAAGLVGLTLFLVAAPSRAETPPDPLRLIPDRADFFLKVEQPRKLIESVTGLELFQQLQRLEIVREYYDSTNYRRLLQLVAYFEKQLGVPWPDIVERVAGGGAVLAVKIEKEPQPVLLAIQGTDEAFVQKFAKLALELVDQELARQEAKERLQRDKYRDIEVVHLGNNVHAAAADAAILVSNNRKALESAIDRRTNKAHGLQSAGLKKLLPPDPLAWAWINLETVKRFPQAKQFFTLPRNDVNQTVLLGSLLDVVGRSSFAGAGLYQRPDGFLVRVRLPAGREGRTADLAPHAPPTSDTTGPLPLLEPKNALVSSSYYFDLSQYWVERKKLFNDKQVKAFEEFDKTSGRFLGGIKFSKLAAQAGPHLRLVATQPATSGYKITPTQRLPSFALVLDMRDKEFAKSMGAVLRGAALIAGAQFNLTLVEEKHSDVKIVGYRFPEGAKLEADVNNIRFNFSPAFAAVGDQYFIASTLELAREMVDLLQAEAKSPAKKQVTTVTERSRVYSSGAAMFLQLIEDQLIAQTILGQALSPAEAKQQAKTLFDLVRRLGVIETEKEYGAKDFRYDVRWKVGK